jgi:hypothetical protein
MRPQNLGETLDTALRIVAARWRVLALVMVVVALPIHIINGVVLAGTTDVYEVGGGLGTGGGSQTTYSDEGAYVTGQIVIAILSVFAYLAGTVACYRAVADTYAGRPTSAGASLRYAAAHFGPALWLALLFIAGVALGLVAFVVPGVWLGILWSVALPAMLAEGLGPVAALRRSGQLVQGHWFATFARLAVAFILAAVASVALTYLVLLPVTAVVDDTSTAGLVAEEFVAFVVSLVTTPFIAAVTALVYVDLRVRKERIDPLRPDAVPPPAPEPARRVEPVDHGPPVGDDEELIGGFGPPRAPD